MKLKLQSILIALSIVCSIQSLQAQKADSVKKGMGKNLFKINLTAIPLNNYSVQYERGIGKRISLVMGFKYMPTGKLPLLSTIESLVDDQKLMNQLNNLQLGSTVFTPEIRLYCGKGVFRGFYLAPFARFGTFTAQMPIDYDYQDSSNPGTIVNQTIPLDGKIKSITGGLMIGAQWKLSKLMYLDWWILGPHYGSSTGSIKVTKALSADEQDGLRQELNDIVDEDNPLKATTTVDANGASIDFKGPFGGIRAGLCLGFRF